jgi:uncharacterized protein YqgV (UPF0045/DUF77 family)
MSVTNDLITVELSFYPLTKDYSDRVVAFVQRLREATDIDLATGGTSTLMRGPHDRVFDLLRDATRDFNRGADTCVFVAKFLNRDAFDAPTLD